MSEVEPVWDDLSATAEKYEADARAFHERHRHWARWDREINTILDGSSGKAERLAGLRRKLASAEALIARPGSVGEKEAAQVAADRLRAEIRRAG